jgi:hypothetical protein
MIFSSWLYLVYPQTAMLMQSQTITAFSRVVSCMWHWPAWQAVRLELWKRSLSMIHT